MCIWLTKYIIENYHETVVCALNHICDSPSGDDIPMDAKLGLIMIYVAGKTASKLQEQDLQNNLINYLLENLRKLFGNIPEPIYTSKKFWENATHVWKPYADSDRISKNILKFSKSDNIYIGGEAFSLHQQWLEGSLDTIENIMKLITLEKNI
jgi:hypothetical protein